MHFRHQTDEKINIKYATRWAFPSRDVQALTDPQDHCSYYYRIICENK